MSDLRDQPIIVGGCHRSGTTLVRRLLDGHPDISCGPEVKFFIDWTGDYEGDRWAHARFFATARSLVPAEELFERAGSLFVGLHEDHAVRHGKRRWADKNPENVLYIPEWERLIGDSFPLVHLIRDPLDVIASMREAGFPHAGRNELQRRAEHWRRYTEAGLDFGERHPDRYVPISYELLTRDPISVCRALMGALGERFDRVQLDALASRSGGLGDPKAGERASVDPESVGRGTEELSPDEARVVEAIAGRAWRCAQTALGGETESLQTSSPR